MRSPTVTGLEAAQTVPNGTPAHPFEHVNIGHVAPTDFISVEINTFPADGPWDQPSNANGDLAGINLISQGNGLYNMTLSGRFISRFLDAVTFTPSSMLAGATSPFATDFAMTITDLTTGKIAPGAGGLPDMYVASVIEQPPAYPPPNPALLIDSVKPWGWFLAG